jgi:(1->4)-alpha-D-glucan 1-alpha-D-glucosylmutase
MNDPRLAQLAELVGILPAYHDIWGELHDTSDKARRALLAAIGVPAGSADEVDTAIHAWQQRHWHQPLPPVLVTRANAAAEVILRLPVNALDATHRWEIHLEHGGTKVESFLPRDLRCLEEMHFNGEDRAAAALALPALSDPGYHRLEIWRDDDLLAEMPLILCPAACYQPPALAEGKRAWGLAVQLYGVRSRSNWGIGDYGDLRRLMDWAAQSGASLVGVNPLHALFPHNPRHCSPYSPSSRQFFNCLHLDIETLPELAECAEASATVRSAEFQARLRALRSADLVDYAGVGEAKYGILEMLYRHFRARHLAHNTQRGAEFRAFQGQGGMDLYRFALYHALQADFYRQDPTLWGWPVWPEAYRDPASMEVRTFAVNHADDVEYHQWLQWLADQQLGAVGQRSLERGLGIGLYQDLAVGVDKGGAETWLHRDLYALDAKVGCPPDEFNPLGQDWGLPPWIPQRLCYAGYAPFIAMLRANMKYAGALRIDHVMSMMRLYWVPPGLKGDEGAYVTYPLDDLLGILALESQRNRCLVVGEDLGTVPGEVRQALHDLGVLSYKLFYFERSDDGGFQPPAHYPEQSLVAATTHDLPTLAGFWKGVDIDLRTQLNLYPSEALRAEQIADRQEDRQRLLRALAREGLLPEGMNDDAANRADLTPALVTAILRYLARSPAKITLLQAEDMLGELEQANLPGTTDAHPNWRRKLSMDLEAWPDDPRIRAIAEGLAAERGRHTGA